MAFSVFEKKRYERIMDAYLKKIRPPAYMRSKLDYNYRIKNQSIEVFEIHPSFYKPNQKIEFSIAKTTYVRSANEWRLYWMRADSKWHRYEPVSEVDRLEDFLKVIEEDTYGCFYG